MRWRVGNSVRGIPFLKKQPLLALALALVACGKRGDPLPPLRPTPQPVTGLVISQRGKELIVRMVAPRASSDGSRLPVLELELLRLEGEGDFGKSAKSSTRKVAPGERLEMTEPLLATGTSLRIAARASHQNRKSVQTSVVLFTVQPEPPTPTEVTARSSAAGVSLAWSAPDPMPCRFVPLVPPPAPAPPPRPGSSPRPANPVGGPATPQEPPVAGQPPAPPSPPAPAAPAAAPNPTSSPSAKAPAAPPGAAVAGSTPQASPSPSATPEPPLPPDPGGFLVYRRAKTGDYGSALNPQLLETPHYDDTSASLGAEVCYEVRTAISTDPLIESDASNEACLTVEDVNAPGAPMGVTTLAVEGGIEVSWSPAVETDLKAYRIQRATKGAKPAQIGEVAAPTTSFQDTTASRDRRYRYTVTVVDQAGNEGPPSAPAEASWP